MEKLIEFLRDTHLLNNHRVITIEMTEEELNKENFFHNYIKEQSSTHLPIGWTATEKEMANIRSITFPHGFTLKIKTTII